MAERRTPGAQPACLGAGAATQPQLANTICPRAKPTKRLRGKAAKPMFRWRGPENWLPCVGGGIGRWRAASWTRERGGEQTLLCSRGYAHGAQ
eukprot:10968970-Lingulodinium_polyedra.AAC.1